MNIKKSALALPDPNIPFHSKEIPQRLVGIYLKRNMSHACLRDVTKLKKELGFDIPIDPR